MEKGVMFNIYKYNITIDLLPANTVSIITVCIVSFY